jgi:serine/threonine protein kinase HipA of HipAB toxin-antitoxin module
MIIWTPIDGNFGDRLPNNISFMLREGMRWELAPAYDVTYSHVPKGNGLGSILWR